MPQHSYALGEQPWTQLPDGRSVAVTFKGCLNNASELPLRGAQLGDEYTVGNVQWILATIPNSNRVGWIDPPASNQPKVRRAFRVDSVEVRRAKMVVPRAELVKLSGN